MRSLIKSALFSVCASVLLAGCNSTTVVSEWTAPEPAAKPMIKVLVGTPRVADPVKRKQIEDQLVAAFPEGVQAVPSYIIFPNPDIIRMANKDQIAARLHKDGFDGALMARVDSHTKREVYVPPYAYPSSTSASSNDFYGYRSLGGTNIGMNVVEGYTYEESNYLIETVLFSIPDGKMVWTMTTESVNSDSKEQIVKELNCIINGTLKKAGYIK